MIVKKLIEELNKMPQNAKVEIVIPVGLEDAISEPCSVELRKDGVVEIV